MPDDSGTWDADLGSDASSAASSRPVNQEGAGGATSGRPVMMAHLTRHIASAPARDHDLPRPLSRDAPTWEFVPSIVADEPVEADAAPRAQVHRQLLGPFQFGCRGQALVRMLLGGDAVHGPAVATGLLGTPLERLDRPL